MIDTSTEFGTRVMRRLQEELIVWLTTVRPDGTPQPSPVWFLWDGASFLIFSQPNTPKLRNIARNPTVALSLNADLYGNDVVIFTGDARIVPDAPLVHEVPAFVEKYRYDLSTSEKAEKMGREYSVAIRVTPTRLRGF
jgi:PPOX class probable F420-dependent enzyme